MFANWIRSQDWSNGVIVTDGVSHPGMGSVVAHAESSHDSLDACARLLTTEGAGAMDAVRAAADALELSLPDDTWPLPKYREMLFPV